MRMHTCKYVCMYVYTQARIHTHVYQSIYLSIYMYTEIQPIIKWEGAGNSFGRGRGGACLGARGRGQSRGGGQGHNFGRGHRGDRGPGRGGEHCRWNIEKAVQIILAEQGLHTDRHIQVLRSKDAKNDFSSAPCQAPYQRYKIK